MKGSTSFVYNDIVITIAAFYAEGCNLHPGGARPKNIRGEGWLEDPKNISSEQPISRQLP